MWFKADLLSGPIEDNIWQTGTCSPFSVFGLINMQIRAFLTERSKYWDDKMQIDNFARNLIYQTWNWFCHYLARLKGMCKLCTKHWPRYILTTTDADRVADKNDLIQSHFSWALGWLYSEHEGFFQKKWKTSWSNEQEQHDKSFKLLPYLGVFECFIAIKYPSSVQMQHWPVSNDDSLSVLIECRHQRRLSPVGQHSPG